jgi:hypothetical protein
MGAYKKYLVELSEYGLQLHPEMEQSEILEILIRESVSEQHPMAYQIMQEVGEIIYDDSSFKRAATHLLKEHYHENNSPAQN